ncbi:hypothetical protein GCM10009006_35150 [Haloarcula argentinensis]|uniref:Uncharacterized protein n=1 Tax=Haloarcula argentinensis TaxID=43776 RepID=A0A830FXD1_HALAR|nr:hypothetical protein GCM10009006_35150 [Haloarcula argentinensis]
MDKTKRRVLNTLLTQTNEYQCERYRPTSGAERVFHIRSGRSSKEVTVTAATNNPSHSLRNA